MKVIALVCVLLVHHATASSGPTLYRDDAGSYGNNAGSYGNNAGSYGNNAGSYGNNAVSRASNEFSMRLLREWSQQSQSDNVLLSGLSAHAALALLHKGAEGNTAHELARVLRLSSANSDISQAYQSTLNSLQRDNSINFANKLYPSSQIQVSRNFISQAKQYFQADVQTLNFNNPSQAAQQINNDVQQETNNKIRNLVNPNDLDGNTALVVVNAIHFQAAWKYPFAQTQQQEFHVSPSQKVSAEMMRQTNSFEYKEDHNLDAKILKMNYDQNANEYSMFFILPNNKNGISSLESKLAQANPENLMQGLRQTRVEVAIPKFQVQETINMKNPLEKMGASEMFSNRANFNKIGNGVAVSKFIQKTFISVDENGTEAAAASGVGTHTMSAPPPPSTHFRADHPFVFAIARQGTIVFVGKLKNPSSN